MTKIIKDENYFLNNKKKALIELQDLKSDIKNQNDILIRKYQKELEAFSNIKYGSTLKLLEDNVEYTTKSLDSFLIDKALNDPSKNVGKTVVKWITIYNHELRNYSDVECLNKLGIVKVWTSEDNIKNIYNRRYIAIGTVYVHRLLSNKKFSKSIDLDLHKWYPEGIIPTCKDLNGY